MKKILYTFIGSFAFFAFALSADAAASLSTSTSSVGSGGSFTVNVNLSGVAAWEVHVSASGPVSGCSINAADSTSDALNGSKSYSATCNATGTGTITVTLSGNTTNESGNRESISGSRTVKVTGTTSYSATNNPKKTNNNSNTNNKTDDSKSSVNTLKSLSVEGLEINPIFNKDVLEYSLVVSNDVKKIKINAEATDKDAKVNGTGEKELNEGENNFDITVTAANGEVKTYKLKVTMDAKPIIVKIGGKEYTVIKNKEQMPLLTLKHEDITLQIEGEDIPAYRIDKLNYVLVALMDSKGKIRLYKFDSYKDNEKPAKYTLFRQFNFKEKNVSYLDFPKKLIPKNYKKFKLKINGEEVTVYKLNKKSNYSLFYGINLETGKKHIYKYDSTEKTIQIYDNEEVKKMQKQINNYEIYILCSIILCSLLLLLLVVTVISKKSFRRKVIKLYNEKMNAIKEEKTNKEN